MAFTGVRYVTEAGNTLYVNGKPVGEVNGAGGALTAIAEMLDDVGHTPCTLDVAGTCANLHLFVEDLRPSPGLDPEASRVLAGLAQDSWDHPRSAGTYQVPGVRTASIQGDTLYLNGEPAGVSRDHRGMEALLAGLHPKEASATVELLGYHANTCFYLDEARIVETHALPEPPRAVEDAPAGQIVSGPSSVRIGAVELAVRS